MEIYLSSLANSTLKLLRPILRPIEAAKAKAAKVTEGMAKKCEGDDCDVTEGAEGQAKPVDAINALLKSK